MDVPPHPPRRGNPTPPIVACHDRRVRRLEYGTGPSQFGELTLPAADTPVRGVAVVVHGGFWRQATGWSWAGRWPPTWSRRAGRRGISSTAGSVARRRLDRDLRRRRRRAGPARRRRPARRRGPAAAGPGGRRRALRGRPAGGLARRPPDVARRRPGCGAAGPAARRGQPGRRARPGRRVGERGGPGRGRGPARRPAGRVPDRYALASPAARCRSASRWCACTARPTPTCRSGRASGSWPRPRAAGDAAELVTPARGGPLRGDRPVDPGLAGLLGRRGAACWPERLLRS